MTDTPRKDAAHDTFTALFSEYYDDELDPDSRALLDGHLAQCEACQHAFDTFRAPLDAMHHMDFTRAPDGFVREVTTSINRRSKGSFFADTWLLGYRVPFEVFAALLLALFGTVYLIGSPNPPELVVTDAPGAPTSGPEAPEGDLPTSSLVREMELPEDTDLATLADHLHTSGFPLQVDIAQGRETLLITLTPDELPRLRARVRAWTGGACALSPSHTEDNTSPVTVRLITTVHGEGAIDGDSHPLPEDRDAP